MDEQQKQDAVMDIKTRVGDALRREGLEPGRMDVSGLQDGHCRLSIELRIPEQSRFKDEFELGPLTLESMALLLADLFDYRLIPGQIRCGKIAKELRKAAQR